MPFIRLYTHNLVLTETPVSSVQIRGRSRVTGKTVSRLRHVWGSNIKVEWSRKQSWILFAFVLCYLYWYILFKVITIEFVFLLVKWN